METLANEKKNNGAQLLEDEELDQATGGNGDNDFIDGKSQSKTGKQKYYG